MNLQMWWIIVDVVIAMICLLYAYQCIKQMRIEKRFYNTLRYFGMTRNEIKKDY